MEWTDGTHYTRRQVLAHTILFAEGDCGDTMYLVVAGRLQVSKRVIAGADKVLTVLGAGQYVGEMSLLSGARRSATVTALDDTEVIEIDQSAFMQLLHDQPQVGLELMRQLAQRVQETTEEMVFTALELALAQRQPRRLQVTSQRMRFLATGSCPREKTTEVLQRAAEPATAQHPALVTSLWRPGRTSDVLVYLIETDNPRHILELIAPFAELVQWDIALAIDVIDALAISTGHAESGLPTYRTR